MPVLRKTLFRFGCEADAAAASAVLSEIPALEDYPLVVGEDREGWFLECYDDCASLAESGDEALRKAGLRVLAHSIETIPEIDWVSETQRLLPPVRAGRFIVHGSHDRSRITSRWAIEIDAGRAFGTAHHGTTRGCLLALDRIGRRAAQSGSVLDLGSGSGVLAIAAAKAFSHRRRIVAVDIDAVAVAVARENIRKNGARSSICLAVGDGRKPASAYRDAPFDLIVANILARPLLGLAGRFRALTRLGGELILSGLLSEQAREVTAKYRAVGFCLVRRLDLEGWAILHLKRLS
jgi:ribosomal protein L11 methyltransferase